MSDLEETEVSAPTVVTPGGPAVESHDGLEGSGSPSLRASSQSRSDVGGKDGSEATGSLQIEIEVADGVALLRLSGKIDESFRRKVVLRRVPEEAIAIVFDLGAVHQITSYGVREWITMLKALPPIYYCFARCRPSIVAQFNVVANFGGKGEVISIYAPYVCGSCRHETDLLLDLRRDRHLLGAPSVKRTPCPKCEGSAEFDDVPESYFAYATTAPAPGPPASVEALIDDGASESRPEPLKVRKEVEGTVTAIWLSGALGESARLKRLADGLEGVVVVDVSGLTGITPQGVARLGEFIDAAGLDVFLARVTPETIRALFRDAAPERKTGKIISVRLPFRCRGCSWRGLLDVDAPFAWLDQGDPTKQPCHECFDEMIIPAVEPEVVRMLLSLPSRQIPDEAREYLSGHGEGPSSLDARSGNQERGARADAPRGAQAGDFGRYRLLRRLGCGGMAEVFLARQVGLRGFEKRVALKRILPHYAATESFVDMFLREARVAARISHPNVVQIFDLGVLNGQYFIAMEYVRGWDLARIIELCYKVDVRLPVHFVCRIGADICAGLHAAHTYRDDDGRALPVVHRDVSPHNVLISSEGVVKVTDFGIAKATDSVSLTTAGELRGKASYMAPERVAGGQVTADARSDIFSVGVVLYEALSLRSLFRRENKYMTFKAVLNDPVPRLSRVRSDVTPELEALLDRALARSPDERFATAQELQLQLEAFPERPVSAAHLSSWLRALVSKGAKMAEESGEEGAAAGPLRE